MALSWRAMVQAANANRLKAVSDAWRLRFNEGFQVIVGNSKVTSSSSSSSNRLAVTDKFTNEEFTHVSLASRDQLDDALNQANEARDAMRNLGAWKRKEVLLQVSDRLHRDRDLIACVIAREAGKPLNDALGEVARAVDTFTLAAEESTRNYGSYAPLDISARNVGFNCITRRFPIGVVGMVSPFNFPLNLVAHKVAPAIAAGCPFVLKPSDRTPITSLILGEILMETNLPKGAFSVVPCRVEDASLISADDRVHVLSFTGSPGVGWKLKQTAGRKKVILELGGNAGCIIDRDCDIDRAVERMLFGAYYYSGQVCISVQRTYVHEEVYDVVKQKLIEGCKRLNQRRGDPLDPNTFLGPMIAESEAVRVENMVNGAVNDGAQVLVGGKRDGPFYDITLLEDTHPKHDVMCKEVFGPVCSITKVSSFKEAVQHINDSEFGLQAGVFTNNIHKAWYAYENIDAGGVVINDVPTVRVDSMPYGGIKSSGIGREGVRYTIEELTDIKTMIMKDIGVDPKALD